jgi:hypothetical protein
MRAAWRQNGQRPINVIKPMHRSRTRPELAKASMSMVFAEIRVEVLW